MACSNKCYIRTQWPQNPEETKKTETTALESQSSDVFKTLDQVEVLYIQQILDFTEGHKGKTCQILDISRPALDRKIVRHELVVSKKVGLV